MILCGSSFICIWGNIIYLGKHLPVTSYIVTLMRQLLNKGYWLVSVNFYTSQFTNLLIDHQTHTYGTLRQNRKDSQTGIKKKIKRVSSF